MEGNVQQGIIDIVMPSAPAYIGDAVLTAFLIMTFAVMLFVIAWQNYHSCRSRCLRQMNGVVRDLINNNEYRKAVYSIARILKDRLSVSRLEPGVVDDSFNNERWVYLLSELDVLRYTRCDITAERVLRIQNEAKYWLKVLP